MEDITYIPPTTIPTEMLFFVYCLEYICVAVGQKEHPYRDRRFLFRFSDLPGTGAFLGYPVSGIFDPPPKDFLERSFPL